MPSLRSRVLTSPVDGLVRLLRSQRAIFHRSLPPFLFVANVVAVTSSGWGQGRRNSSARKSLLCVLVDLRHSRERVGYGACAGKQDEFLLAMGPRRSVISRHAWETNPERGSVGKGQ